MALYGGLRDISMFRRVNRELMGNIISQEVIYYKYKIGETKTNMYGEASEGRTFADPVMLFALVEVVGSAQSAPVSDLGVDFNWPLVFRFLKDDLLSKLSPINQGSFGTFQNPSLQYGAEIRPEPGDIIAYQNAYWEVDNTNSTQLTTGKDSDFPYYDSNGNNPLNPGLEEFGWSVEVKCECHYVPSDRVNIISSRM